MTPTIPHVLLSVHGVLPGGDTWSCGVRSLAWADPLGDTKGNALSLAAGNLWRVFSTRPQTANLFSQYTGITGGVATVDGVTVRRINEDGLTAEQFEVSPTTAATPQSGGANVNLPPQNCLVVTLMTARAGRTGKGRIYLPAIGDLGLSQARISTTVINNVSTDLKNLFDGMNTALHTATDAANFLAVQSAKASAEPGAWTVGAPSGYMGAKIIAVRVGNAADTQRRRRNNIVEAYTTTALA